MTEKDNQLAKDIGARIAQRRKELGWTQEQAAEKADLSQQFFACVERGIKNIRAESIIKISKSMDISADYLLMGKCTNIDRSNITKLFNELDHTQLMLLEKIIKNYIDACNHSSNK